MMADFNYYDYGDQVIVSAAFTDASMAAVDPDVVKLSVLSPDAILITYIYGTDIGLIKDSTGNYHFNIDVEQAGQWFYRWYSTGNGQAAVETHFEVRESLAH